jgi:hypothetical protein
MRRFTAFSVEALKEKGAALKLARKVDFGIYRVRGIGPSASMRDSERSRMRIPISATS